MTNDLQPIQENENFIITKNADGTFTKTVKYQKVFSTIPESDDDFMKLYSVMNDPESKEVTSMKDAIGLELDMVDFYTSPYESFDEKTGENTQGVTSLIKDVNGAYFATSSKAVYFSLLNLFDVFGDKWQDKNIRVKIVGVKQPRGLQINLSVLGFSK